MKIAITASGKDRSARLDLRFGRAPVFMVYDDQTNTFEALDNEQNLNSAQGAGIQSAATIVNAGCKALITGHCGPKAYTALSKAQVAVYSIKDVTVGEAVALFKDGKCQKMDAADVEGHW